MSKMHKTFYYARVSTREQNLDRQLEAFRALGADDREIITDKESGKNLDRPGYQALKSAMLRSGDTLVVKSLDRLSRSKADIHSELQWFKQNNIHLKMIDLPTTMMDLPPGQEWVFEMVNNILIEVLGTIAEQERLTIHQRRQRGASMPRNQRQTPRAAFHFPAGQLGGSPCTLASSRQNHRTRGHAANRDEANNVLSACP